MKDDTVQPWCYRLFTDAIDVQPRYFDFGGAGCWDVDIILPAIDTGDSWGRLAATRILSDYLGEDPPNDPDEFERAWFDFVESQDCYGMVDPVMNYLYPLPRYSDTRSPLSDVDVASTSEDQTKLLANVGSICLVDVDGETFLALTGGGMDLSDRICAAYVELGYCPPAHFAAMVAPWQRPGSELIEACRESLRIAKLWASGALDEFNQRFPSEGE